MDKYSKERPGIEMKLKYYIRGFGVGIIFTALILSMLRTPEKNVMSNEEIMEQAKELGMVDPNEADIKMLETTVPTDKNTPVPTKEVEKKEIVVTMTPKVKNTSKPKKTKKTAVEKEMVSITVERGMWSEKICQKLQELGVVDDGKALDKYLCENGYASNIKPGVYKVNKGASYEEIAKALTK